MRNNFSRKQLFGRKYLTYCSKHISCHMREDLIQTNKVMYESFYKETTQDLLEY